MSALRKALESLPPESLVPAGWVLKNLVEPDRVSWIGTARAGEILDEPERKVRRLAVRWERAAASGRPCPVRVSRKSGAAHSHLLLCEEDCWALRRTRGAVQPVEDSGDEDSDIARDIVRRHFG